MLLSGKTIQSVNTITHDGKVLCFGTDDQGYVYYSVKRSGFENAALAAGADPFGFEGWRRLSLDRAQTDPSVTAWEAANLVSRVDGRVLLRSVYGSGDDVQRTLGGPVQLVSALGHLFVFRQSTSGKILMTRFVLDGMNNELLPRLEVRYQRSRQRLTPQQSGSEQAFSTSDNLDYRDLAGQYFYEPSVELGFIDSVAPGQFAVVLAPTSESDRHRWHLFVTDAVRQGLVMYTVGATETGQIDLTDYRYSYADAIDPTVTRQRVIPGIVRRSVDLQGYAVVGAPTASTYDLQQEQITDAGPQLVRGAMRVMLAVPVQASGSTVTQTAAVSLGLAADGLLAQIDSVPDGLSGLVTSQREVLLPLPLLDGIVGLAQVTPPPSGGIAATQRGEGDLLQVRSDAALPNTLSVGDQVVLQNSASYNGPFTVASVDGSSFEIVAAAAANSLGTWGVVRDTTVGLVFDGMIVGSEKSATGRLRVQCSSHDLQVGDEVQISGTRDYNGTFPVVSIDGDRFVVDAPYPAGQVANLSRVVRRGLRMAPGDGIATPDLELAPPSPSRSLGRTLSTWVRVDGPPLVEVMDERSRMAGNIANYSIRSAQAALDAGWDQLGVAFVVYSEPAPGTVPVYRETPIQNPGSQFHLSTRTADDAGALGWQQQLAFYAYATQMPGTVPVYREEANGVFYFSTQTPTESVAFGFGNLGVAFYAYPKDAVRTGQTLAVDEGGMMRLGLGEGNKPTLRVTFADGSVQTVVDATPLAVGTWTHVAATLSYQGAGSGETALALLRNGVQVAQAQIAPTMPSHLGASQLNFDGGNDYVDVPALPVSYTGGITAEAWVLLDNPGQASVDRTIFCEKRPSNAGDVLFTLKVNGAAHCFEAGFYVQSENRWCTVLLTQGLPLKTWTHVAASYDGHRLRLYINGAEVAVSNDQNRALPTTQDGWYIGRRHDLAPIESMWRGQIADVRLWNRVRTAAEINAAYRGRLTGRETGLVGYWPLENGVPRDLGPHRRHGTLFGSPGRRVAPVLHPQSVPPPAPDSAGPTVLQFDGSADAIEIAAATPALAAQFTLSLWFRLAAGPGGVRTLLSCRGRDGSALRGLAVQILPSGALRFAVGDGATPMNIAGPMVTPETWIQLIAVMGAGTFSIYLDGALYRTVTCVYASPDGPLWICAQAGTAGPVSFFPGAVADLQIYPGARTPAEFATDRLRRLCGAEPGLYAHYPLERDASDNTANRRHGVLYGTPRPVPSGSAHRAGSCLPAEIADFQVWGQARDAATIRATMNLALIGTEAGLAVGYRLGALLPEDATERVVDFSVHARNGRVSGTPYAGARRLSRATQGGGKIVLYRSDEVTTVSAGAMYEESFEFKVTSPASTFDPNQVAGGRLFQFSYWGKSGHDSEGRINFPADSVQQIDFVPLASGWYRATCRVTVPDGVRLMRLFELSAVRGLWAGEESAPPGEWTAIDIRRHQLQLIESAITRAEYTDALPLEPLSVNSAAARQALDQVRLGEANIARLEDKIVDLQQRIVVANNTAAYQTEKTQKETEVAGLRTQRGTAITNRQAILNDPLQYFMAVYNMQSQSCLWNSNNKAYRSTSSTSTGDSDTCWLSPSGSGDYAIRVKSSNWALTAPASVQNPQLIFTDLAVGATPNTYQRWRLLYRLVGDVKVYGLVSVAHAGTDPNLTSGTGAGKSPDSGSIAIELAFYQKFEPRVEWLLNQSSTLNPDAQAAVISYNTSISGWDTQIAELDARIAWLASALGSTESANLSALLTAAQNELAAAKTALATQAGIVMTALRQATSSSQGAMPTVARDARGLLTTAALLDFAQPVGRLRLAESCDGNLLLSYFDREGRSRLTTYDAVADRRNSAFEQWLPDGLRACVDLRDATDSLTLSRSLSVAAGGFACEVWAQYPPPKRSDGSEPDFAILGAASAGSDATLALRKGGRLGVLIDGWFFDSGMDLTTSLAAGWHHFAVSASPDRTRFYIDGNPIGGCANTRSLLRLNGSSDSVEVPAHASPTAAVTVSAWARSSTPNWNNDGVLASKRPAFILHPNVNTRFLGFSLQVNGAWYTADFPPADIQTWHHYCGTYDGASIRLFVDGVQVNEKQIAGSIAASSDKLYLGRDYGNGVDRRFNGDLGEVAYFSRALSGPEVRKLYLESAAGNEPGLIGLWSMTPTTIAGVQKVADRSSSARDAVIVGNPTTLAPTTTSGLTYTRIGNRAAGGAPGGRLAEFRLWNGPLSDAEIAANAQGVLSGYEPGLLAYFPLTEADGAAVYDRVGGGGTPLSATLSGVDPWPCAARIGNPGSKVLSLADGSGAWVKLPSVALNARSFSVECWVRRSGADIGQVQLAVSLGPFVPGSFFHFGYRENNYFTLGFGSNDIDSASPYTDNAWHHFCGTYDQATHTQRLYVDGQLVNTRTGAADFAGTGELWVGKAAGISHLFMGEVAELRFWNGARSLEQVRALMYQRAVGNEAGLLVCYPFNQAQSNGTSFERKSGTWVGESMSGARLQATTNLPISAADHLVFAEYSSVELASDGRKTAMMRRCRGYASAGTAVLLPEARIEELSLLWVGNTQMAPTLLGYIEGAPPVPSENLTVSDDYAGATSVTLRTAADTSYAWQRSETQSIGVAAELYAGIEWDAEVTSGEAGVTIGGSGEAALDRSSALTSTSSLIATDSLSLSGRQEDRAALSQLGRRWLPKNLGYAQVISGMADVYVLRLARSGRMVSYDIRPVPGVPLDINTITFLINPAYTQNGSLDGMVGSSPADRQHYAAVPELRAQLGSLVPASYFRLQEAYALRDSIERQDKDRESSFYNFNPAASDDSSVAFDPLDPGKALSQLLGVAGFARASAAFADWQGRMDRLLAQAGKRNLVNTYVWDGDGGLRAEEQSFASTIEHSISTATLVGGSLGISGEVAAFGYKVAGSVVASGSLARSSGKTLSSSKSLELSVDLSGVERNGITNLKDAPLVPGEKVDRYRFMTFYLEGSTGHFDDFFRVVVDPVWLASNTEGARALRQTRAAKPNKCWRVLHRVTYVERPTL